MGKYISQLDVENALSAATIAELFVDDASAGVVNALALEQCIDLAEGEVDSFLLGVNDVASLKRFDRLLRLSAIDFFKVFAFSRHPEYVKTYGEDPRSNSLYKAAVARMQRIQAATQELPDQQGGQPQNVGAIIRSTGPRLMIDSPNGTENGAGF